MKYISHRHHYMQQGISARFIYNKKKLGGSASNDLKEAYLTKQEKVRRIGEKIDDLRREKSGIEENIRNLTDELDTLKAVQALIENGGSSAN